MSKMQGISPKLPLTYSTEDGPYTLNKSLGAAVKQNFKNLLLTVPGERIMVPEFGAGMYQMLFEPMAGKTYQEIAARVYSQVDRYMPFLDISSIEFETADQDLTLDANQVRVIIEYNVGSLNLQDTLKITSAGD
jgi:phage baseplate assembly protein W|tara:strand:+ start:72 stop:473 length:402 start_codon:yes stop_codon:yes gene_type:complete